MATGPPMETPIVAPTGSALASASVPRLPLAPGLLSITKLWASFCCSRSAISRATMSGVDPGPNGTTILTVFVGQSCAAAGASAHSDPANAIARLVFIRFSRILCHATSHSSRAIGSLQAGSLPQRRLSRASSAARVTALPPDLPWPLLRPLSAVPGHARRRRDSHGPIGHRTGVVSRRACLRDAARAARRRDRAHRRVALQGIDGARLAGRAHRDRLRLRPLPRDRLDRDLVAAAMDLSHHRVADVAGKHLRRCRLCPRQYLAHAQASLSGGREDVGRRASYLERRSRLDRAVRLLSRLGGL